MFWFNSNKKKEKKRVEFIPQSTKQKVEENIYSCKRSKNKLLDKRDELKKRINGTINSTYYVPSALWYKEFEHYEKIQEIEQNNNLNSEIRSKCDEIITAYLNELKLIEVQIEHYDFLLSTYLKTLDKIYNSKDEFQVMLSDLQKMKQLENSNTILNQIKEESDELLVNELLQEEKYKDVKLEIDNLQKDLDLFEEYINQLKQLK